MGAKPYYFASVSGGKDSVCMFYGLVDRGLSLDEVLFYDTGMEFACIYLIISQIEEVCLSRGIKFTRLYPKLPFEYNMFEKPRFKRGSLTQMRFGKRWCGGTCRWGTREKIDTLDKYIRQQSNPISYVGIAVDESHRLLKEQRPYKRFPLIDWGYEELDCLQDCYQRGIIWEEGGIRLYDILDRVSCWCCRNKNLKELELMWMHLPHYWEKLKKMQDRLIEPMKERSGSIHELEVRFEDKWQNSPKVVVKFGPD